MEKTTSQKTDELTTLLLDNEEWLMARILFYAKRQDYAKYTSTLVEAWRISISGLSSAIIQARKALGDTPPQFSPGEDYTGNPIAAFAIEEARLHRERGISLKLFLGLLKYYRQSFQDLVREKISNNAKGALFGKFVIRSFDLLELALCAAWVDIKQDDIVQELQVTNRNLTNEKNKYLSLFESLSDPVFLLNEDDEIEHLNPAASKLIGFRTGPGKVYYSAASNSQITDTDVKNAENGTGSHVLGEPVTRILPWLNETITAHRESLKESMICEVQASINGDRLYFIISIMPMRDISDKFKGSIIVLTDVTDYKNTQMRLEINEERLKLATQAGGIGVWEWDIVQDNLIWDEHMMELYHITEDEFSGSSDIWVRFIHPDDFKQTDKTFRESLKTTGLFSAEYRLLLPDKSIRNIKSAARVQYDNNRKPFRMIGVNWDVTQQKQMEEKIIMLASTDPLTGVNNRRNFLALAHKECVRSLRYNTPVSILMIDIDHFKNINDTHGHHIGDFALKKFCSTCLNVLREGDIFGRLGGEEFAAILVQTDLDAAVEIAERLRAQTENTLITQKDISFLITISIGVSEFNPGDKEIDDALRRADQALYRAKRNGRNQVLSSIA